jgi:hypothetical protein
MVSVDNRRFSAENYFQGTKRIGEKGNIRYRLVRSGRLAESDRQKTAGGFVCDVKNCKFVLGRAI